MKTLGVYNYTSTPADLLAACENAPVYVLRGSSINEPQKKTIEEMMKYARGGNQIDIIIRTDGVERRFEADWVKKLEAQPK